jgi:hypothetical protein
MAIAIAPREGLGIDRRFDDVSGRFKSQDA